MIRKTFTSVDTTIIIVFALYAHAITCINTLTYI